MQENNSKKRNPLSVKKILMIFLLLGVVCGILLSIISIKNNMYYFNARYGEEHEHDEYCYKVEYMNDYYKDERNYDNYHGDTPYEQLHEHKFDCPRVVYGNAFLYAISIGDAWFIFLSCIAGSILLSGLFMLIRKFKKKQKEEEKKLNTTTNILD